MMVVSEAVFDKNNRKIRFFKRIHLLGFYQYLPEKETKNVLGNARSKTDSIQYSSLIT